MAHRLWVRHLIDLSNGHTKTLQKIDIEITEVIIFFEGVEGVSRSWRGKTAMATITFNECKPFDIISAQVNEHAVHPSTLLTRSMRKKTTKIVQTAWNLDIKVIHCDLLWSTLLSPLQLYPLHSISPCLLAKSLPCAELSEARAIFVVSQGTLWVVKQRGTFEHSKSTNPLTWNVKVPWWLLVTFIIKVPRICMRADKPNLDLSCKLSIFLSQCLSRRYS